MKFCCILDSINLHLKSDRVWIIDRWFYAEWSTICQSTKVSNYYQQTLKLQIVVWLISSASNSRWHHCSDCHPTDCSLILQSPTESLVTRHQEGCKNCYTLHKCRNWHSDMSNTSNSNADHGKPKLNTLQSAQDVQSSLGHVLQELWKYCQSSITRSNILELCAAL